MKTLLSRLFTPVKATRDTSQIMAQAYEESKYTSLWEDTGEVYYLWDTLKLSYESVRGLVTFEKLSRDDVLAIMADINEGRLAPLKPKVTAEQKAEIRISVSGLSWQAFNGTTRTKAIPEAAILRTTELDFANAQALFKHADLISSIDSALLFLPNQTNVFTYNDVGPEQFFAQIDSINQRFMPNDTSKICLNRANYDAPFSEREQRLLTQAQDAIEQLEQK